MKKEQTSSLAPPKKLIFAKMKLSSYARRFIANGVSHKLQPLKIYANINLSRSLEYMVTDFRTISDKHRPKAPPSTETSSRLNGIFSDIIIFSLQSEALRLEVLWFFLSRKNTPVSPRKPCALTPTRELSRGRRRGRRSRYLQYL